MIHIFLIITLFSISALAQGETVTNHNIVEMSRAGISAEVILRKIASSRTAFVVTSDALVELKQAGVADEVILVMMEQHEKALPHKAGKVNAVETNDSVLSPSVPNPKEALAIAKTIAFGKSSLQPSRQALEKELLKRADFRKLNLTILRYKEHADLFVDIGFVSGSWITHRYVYRIYDRRSGAVVAAGETTSWGSLAENLARHISKRLVAARTG